MALTQGQIESFYLICLNALSVRRTSFVSSVLRGLVSPDTEKWFYTITGMMGCIWMYKPNATGNCLSLSEVETIMNKLNLELNLNICLEELPETYLNALRDFKAFDFNTNDFA